MSRCIPTTPQGITRRQLHLLTVSGLLLGSGTSTAQNSAQLITRNDFENYLEIFNLGDSDAYADYYHDDVVMERGDLRLEGKTQILDFYRSFHANVNQHIELLDFIAAEDRLAVELMASFEVMNDWSHPFAGTYLKGSRRKANTFVHYNLKNGKFVLIRSARFRSFEN